MKNRLFLAVLSGAILGIFCIIGIGFRFGFVGNEWFLFSAWYNRVIMGLLIGLAGSLVLIKSKYNPVVRGLILGFIVSYAWYLDTAFADPMGFLAGVVYGLIIDVVASRYSK